MKIHGPAKDLMRPLLPLAISVVETSELATIESLLPEELDAIARAVPKRAREYATGRRCAREALARMDIHGFPLRPNPDRAPVWPREIVGSITHTEGFCAAAVGRKTRFAGIGIDAEADGSAGKDLWPLLFTNSEIAWLGRLPQSRQTTMATVLFSAKESFYKAQYSLTGAWLDFQSVTVCMHSDGWSLQLMESRASLPQLLQPFRGRFAIHGGLIVTAITIDTGSAPDRTTVRTGRSDLAPV